MTITTTLSTTIIENPRRFRLVQMVWGICTLIVIALLIANIGLYAHHLSTADSLYPIEEVMKLGFSRDAGILFLLANEIAYVLLVLAVSALILYYRSHDWLALLTITVLFALCDTFFISYFYGLRLAFPALNPFLNFVYNILGMITMAVYILLPNGKLIPRWSGLLLLFHFVLFGIVDSFIFSLPDNVYIPVWYGLQLIATGVVYYRYFRVFQGAERQQMKLVVITATIVIIANFAVNYIEMNYVVMRLLIEGGLTMLMTIAFIVGLLRYRMWDIDIAINRLMAYGLVTVFLGAVFLIVNFLIQSVFGEGIAFVVCVIGVVLLFNPIYKRAQHWVDLYIYGFRFDQNEIKAAQQIPQVKNPGALTGSQLGEYEVLDLLGEGGMGEVYKGFGKDKTVAIKIMKQEIASDQDALKRFQREAQIGMELNHPNIVKVYEMGQANGVYYMIMEYIEGDSLGDLIRASGRLPVERVLPYLNHLADALDTAHREGYIHRDIKPTNVMLRGNGDQRQVVLMDFGISKEREETEKLNDAGMIGTIGYMAPEQIMAASDVEHYTDIYALGVLLFEALTGQLPFKGSPVQIMFAHIQQPPPDPRQMHSDIPARAADAVLKALAKEPKKRFQTAKEFAASLV